MSYIPRLSRRLLRLSEPIPIKRREKYIPPPKPRYTYLPSLVCRKYPQRECGRPFQPVKVPKDFQHELLEIDFWWNVSFPVRRGALKYKATERIKQLAQPNVLDLSRLHCPLPPKEDDFIPKRRRMSKQQWCSHLLRLEYLAKPAYRPFYDDEQDHEYFTKPFEYLRKSPMKYAPD